ncbi:MAG: hypothetical protein ONB17_11585, partial [candidate division KSB1 bacterium]|nr:hypothetical protein [candidate division KSB1 bacterium]
MAAPSASVKARAAEDGDLEEGTLMLVYYNGHYMQETEVCLPPYERGFQFADGVYEVIRCYYGVFFQTEAHLARMARGLRELRIQAPDL